MELVFVRRLTLRLVLGGPAGTADRADREGPELVEREHSIRERVGDLLDAIKLGVAFGVVGFLSRFGSLKRHIVRRQDLTEPFAFDLHDPTTVVGERRGQFAHRPASERVCRG